MSDPMAENVVRAPCWRCGMNVVRKDYLKGDGAFYSMEPHRCLPDEPELGKVLDKIESEVVGLESERNSLLRIVQELEWVWDSGTEEEWCDICDRRRDDGHDSSCRLAAALAGHRDSDDPG